MTKESAKNKKQKFIETDFLSGIESILAARLSLSAWFIPLALMILIIFLLAWAWVSEVDVVSPATGEIIPSEEIQLIQPKEVGVVKSILVKNGDQVKKDQLLIQLEDSDIQSQLAELTEQLKQLTIETVILDRQKQCINNPEHCLDSQGNTLNFKAIQNTNDSLLHTLSTESRVVASQLFLQRWQQFIAEKKLKEDQLLVLQSELVQKEKEIAYGEKILPIYRKRSARMLALQEDNLTAGSKVEEALEQEIEQEQRLANAQYEQQNLLAQINVSQSELKAFVQETKTKINDEWFIKKGDYQVKRKNEERLQQLLQEKHISSPIDGTIYDKSIVSIGGVVQSGEVLMKVIPKGSILQAKINILNKDRGFIKEGDSVIVKVDAYPFTKHGSIRGEIRQISQAAILDEQLGPVYPAIINLLQRKVMVNKQPAVIIPGMTITADIYQGKRLLAEYVLTPLLRYKDEALRER